MYFTSDTTINAVRSFGLEHPKPVARLLEAADKLEAAADEQPGWEGVFDPAKVIDTVRAQARHEIETGQALRTACNAAASKIAARLSREVENDLGFYTDQLEARFDTAASDYAEAVRALPREFTSNDVTGWDTATFDAFTTAKQANAVLEQAKQWMLSLGQVVRSQQFPQEFASEFLVLDPENLEEYAAIQTAGEAPADSGVRAVNPVRMRAAQDGVALRLSLPAQVRETAAGFEQQRHALSPQEWQRVYAGVARY